MAMSKEAPGKLAWPILEGFARVSLGVVQGYSEVARGELETYTVGRRRFVTEDALQRYLKRRLQASADESPRERAAKVEEAVAARRKRRAEEAAA